MKAEIWRSLHRSDVGDCPSTQPSIGVCVDYSLLLMSSSPPPGTIFLSTSPTLAPQCPTITPTPTRIQFRVVYYLFCSLSLAGLLDHLVPVISPTPQCLTTPPPTGIQLTGVLPVLLSLYCWTAGTSCSLYNPPPPPRQRFS